MARGGNLVVRCDETLLISSSTLPGLGRVSAKNVSKLTDFNTAVYSPIHGRSLPALLLPLPICPSLSSLGLTRDKPPVRNLLLSSPHPADPSERDKTKDETRARDKFRPINLSQVQRERKEGGQERDAAAQRDQHLSHSESVVVIAMMREKRRSEEAQVGMRWREIIGVEVI